MNDENEIEDLEIPDFKSVIPGYLADGMTPAEKHTIETLSILAQRIDFYLKVTREHHRTLQVVKLRTEKLERVLLIFRSKWAIVIGIFMFVAPVLFAKVLNALWK